MSEQYTKTDEPIKVGDVVYRREIPTPDVAHKDARFFVYTFPYMDGGHFDVLDPLDTWIVDSGSKGWGNDSAFRRVEPIPDLGEDWQLCTYDFSYSDIEKYLPDFSVRADRAHWFADIYATAFGIVVSEKVRHAIEELDPSNSLYFPVNITVQGTGQPIEGDRFYWRPKREILYNLNKNEHRLREVENYRRAHGPNSGFKNKIVLYELHTNNQVRDYLATIPFWTFGYTDTFTFANWVFGMSAPVFASFKSRLITGLREAVGDNYDDEDFDKSCNVRAF